MYPDTKANDEIVFNKIKMVTKGWRQFVLEIQDEVRHNTEKSMTINEPVFTPNEKEEDIFMFEGQVRPGMQ